MRMEGGWKHAAFPKIEEVDWTEREGCDPTTNSHENMSPKGRNERSRGPGEIVIFVFQPLEQRVENGVNRTLVGSIPFRSHQ